MSDGKLMMSRSSRLKQFVFCLVCCFVVVPLASSSAGERESAFKTGRVENDRSHLVSDLQLAAGGMLFGRLVDSGGVGIARATVTIHHNRHEVARIVTAGDGTFRLKNLKGGVYQIVGGGKSRIFRLWSPETAPPAARRDLLLVSARQLVRGQNWVPFNGPFGMNQWIGPGIIATGLVSAGITAIVVGTHDSESVQFPSSP